MNTIEAYIQKNKEYILNLAMDICKIPSMTGHEDKKAAYIKSRLMEICGEGVIIDEAGNVLYMHSSAGSERLSISSLSYS